jgi:hypothetical protein
VQQHCGDPPGQGTLELASRLKTPQRAAVAGSRAITNSPYQKKAKIAVYTRLDEFEE